MARFWVEINGVFLLAPLENETQLKRLMCCIFRDFPKSQLLTLMDWHIFEWMHHHYQRRSALLNTKYFLASLQKLQVSLQLLYKTFVFILHFLFEF